MQRSHLSSQPHPDVALPLLDGCAARRYKSTVYPPKADSVGRLPLYQNSLFSVNKQLITIVAGDSSRFAANTARIGISEVYHTLRVNIARNLESIKVAALDLNTVFEEILIIAGPPFHVRRGNIPSLILFQG